MDIKNRNYELEKKQRKPNELKFSSSHPLSYSSSISSSSLFSDSKAHSISKKNNFIDPLSEKNDFCDPLSKYFHSSSHSFSKIHKQGFNSWEEMRDEVLKTFTTSRQIPINILSPQAPSSNFVPKKQVQHRLDQLDELEEGTVKTKTTMTQNQYLSQIRQLGIQIEEAWSSDQRVKTLKLSIQCAKLLSDTSICGFYPSKFVVVADTLHSFGSMVFKRLLQKSGVTKATIDVSLASESGKETCRNWLFKIASIRELLPRILVELSVVKCLRFLSYQGDMFSWKRLLLSMRGVADPLVAINARCYFCRVIEDSEMEKEKENSSQKTLPSSSSSSSLTSTYTLFHHTDPFTFLPGSPPSPSSLVNLAIKDSIFTLLQYHQQNQQQQQQQQQQQLMHQADDISLRSTDVSCYGNYRPFIPAFKWLFRCLFFNLENESKSNKLISDLFNLIQSCNDDVIRSLLIGSFISQCPLSFLLKNLFQLMKLIEELEGKENLCCDVPSLLCCLSSPFTSLCESLDPKESKSFFNRIWTLIIAISNQKDYMSCVKAYSPFMAMRFGRKEVNLLLGDVINKLSDPLVCQSEQENLQVVMETLATCKNCSFIEFASCQNFSPFLSLFQLNFKTKVCTNLFSIFQRRNREDEERENGGLIVDPVTTHTLTEVAKVIHDAVDPLTGDEEVRERSRLIVHFISKVFLKDPHQSLQFYSDCRSTFSNMDPVLCFLVQRVLLLTNQNLRISSFCRSCCAFCFITIPSLNSVFHRLNLYLLLTQTCLHSLCTSQALDSMEAAIGTLKSIPRYLEVEGKLLHTDPLFVESVGIICSLLILTPDHPNLPSLNFFQILLSQIDNFKFDDKTDAKIKSLCKVMVALATIAQPKYPYSISFLVSNDDLYGSDPKFLKTVSCLLNEVLQKIYDVNNSFEGERRQTFARVARRELEGHFGNQSKLFERFH